LGSLQLDDCSAYTCAPYPHQRRYPVKNRRKPVSSSDRERKQRSLFSARKVALMASVVAGFAMSGFGPSSNHFDIFGSAAQAGVGNAVSSAAQPIGFADTVERVKPSVISVKVTM